MPDNSGFGFFPALSRLFGEVEQPTDPRSMMAPNFGGSPEMLQQMMSSPQMQQQLGQHGAHFDPNSVRQSPFFPNQFMQQHPHLGGMLNNAMSNVAATPEAPMVSGAGSGMTRAMQGMMGGPELQRQYQVRQMLAPMQMAGAQMPMQEFERKQQLLQLLQQMEQDRATAAQNAPENHAQATPYGLLTRHGTGPQTMQQPMGDQNMGGMQGFQQKQPMPPSQQVGGFDFTPYPPEMMKAQTEAKQPDALNAQRNASAGMNNSKANETNAEIGAGMPAAKVGEAKSRTNRNNAGAGKLGAETRDINQFGGRGKLAQDRNQIKMGEDYNKAQGEYQKSMQAVDLATEKMRASGKFTPEQIDQYRTQEMQRAQQGLMTNNSNLDNAAGKPGQSEAVAKAKGAGKGQTPPPQLAGKGSVNAAPGPQQGAFNPQEINQHPEMVGKPPGTYRDKQTGATFQWDGKQAAGQNATSQQR